MKPSEKEVLDTLRKTTLAYLSESDYAQIEKAVEQQGILNLTGTASAVVKSAVQKHGGGSHDQQTHGSWANGAGGKDIGDMTARRQFDAFNQLASGKSGGGSSSSSTKQDNAKDKADPPGTKSKEQALSRRRNDKKVSEIAERLSEFSDKYRKKPDDLFRQGDNARAADKFKAISEKLTEAANADISSRRHYALVSQAYDKLHKMGEPFYYASQQSIIGQTSNYLRKLDDDLEYDYEGKTWDAVQKHEGGGHDQATHGSWAGTGAGAVSTKEPQNAGERAWDVSNTLRTATWSDIDGTSKMGDITATRKDLTEALGNPEIGATDKSTIEWSVVDRKTGVVATVYDWKRRPEAGSRSEYATKPPAMEESMEFSVGGTKGAVSLVQNALFQAAKIKINKSAVQKHGGGSHDQRSHGAWAGNGYGDGKFIQDKVKAPNTNDSVRRLSEIDSELADLKEYENRVKSAKSGAEIRAIMAEYKNQKNGGGKKSASDERNARGADSFARGKKALEGKDYKTVMADYDKMESTWRKKTYKPFDVENGGGGDPQDLAEAQFRAKYGASVLDVAMYGQSTLKKA